MIRTAVSWHSRPRDFILECRSLAAFLLVLIACGIAAFAEDAIQPNDAGVSIRATHLLGFEGAKNNANGTLTVTADALRFQKEGRPPAEVKITSVQDVFLGDESRQVGGLPMTLGKAAVPFGGGRAVSLFAHKKYDTITIEYVDTNGGVHGAIFQINKGQGEVLRNELVARGAHVTNNTDEATKQRAAEVSSEKQ